MSLTTTARNRLADAINMAFDAIGVDKETKMPKSKSDAPSANRSPIAWEYFVATYVEARAKARAKKAKAAAVAAGIIFDHEKSPKPPGTNEPVFTGEHVSVWLTVNNPATQVSADKMSTYLMQKGVSQKLINDAYEFASTQTKAAHIFKVSMVSPDR